MALCVVTVLPYALAQDVHPVSSGSVQSVRGSVSQNVHAGAIARTTGGERAGLGGFSTSEASSRVVSGRVSGYGARMGTGSLTEYASQGTARFGGGSDFPSSDFVGTMPRPGSINYGAFSNGSGASSFGVTLSAVQTHGSSIGRSGGAHKTVHHRMKDPEAILNPFTHSIGPSMGSLSGLGSLKETVPGAPRVP